MSDAPDDPNCRKDRRLLTIAILVGVLAGAGHGVKKYGLFSVGNAALIGLGVIVVVGIFAAVIALMPARPAE